MKFKSKLSLLGLALLISGVNVHAMDNLAEQEIRDLAGKVITVKYNRTAEGLIQAYADASKKDKSEFHLMHAGKPLNSGSDVSGIAKESCLMAVPIMKKVSDTLALTEGTTPKYKAVTDRVKRKVGEFKTNYTDFEAKEGQKKFSECGEPLMYASLSIDSIFGMRELNAKNRAEIQAWVLQAFKIGFDPDELNNEEKLLKITSHYDAMGNKKAPLGSYLIQNFHSVMKQLLISNEQKAALQDLKTFFKENIIRSNTFYSLAMGYAIKNPDEPKEKYEINRYAIENLGFGDHEPMNDWLTCPLKVARQVIEEFNTEAGSTGQTFGDIVISIRQFNKELKVGDTVIY